MTDDEWLTSRNPHAMLVFVAQKVSERKLRLVAVASCRRAKPFMEDDYHDLPDVVESFCGGQATADDIEEVLSRHSRSNDYPDRTAFYDTAAPDICENVPHLVDDLGYFIARGLIDDTGMTHEEWSAAERLLAAEHLAVTAAEVRDIIGNPFRPVLVPPSWLTPVTTGLAQAAYEVLLPSGHLDLPRLAVLSDALEEAGCTDPDLLTHLRSSGPHVRGCWALDALLAKG